MSCFRGPWTRLQGIKYKDAKDCLYGNLWEQNSFESDSVGFERHLRQLSSSVTLEMFQKASKPLNMREKGIIMVIVQNACDLVVGSLYMVFCYY